MTSEKVKQIIATELEQSVKRNTTSSIHLNYLIKGEDANKFDYIAGALHKSRAELAKLILTSSLDDWVEIVSESTGTTPSEKGEKKMESIEEKLERILTPKIKLLKIDQTFELKLLAGDDWNEFTDNGEKNRAGRIFRKIVDKHIYSGHAFSTIEFK